MTFEPQPGMQIYLGGERILFTSLEEQGLASMFVYAEAGKEATVYRVLKNQEYYALKVFYPAYQDKRLIKNTEKINKYQILKGLRVADRTLINRKTYPDLIEKFPELNYSVLMPWIEGNLWGTLMADDRPLRAEQYLQIALSLMETVCNLESEGLAHCDLSSNNFIISQDLSYVELIGLEDMYAPDMPRPIPDISYGTPGYRARWIAEDGLWEPYGDRFASAILCAEIIAWQFKEIRESKAGDSSFFDESEIGQYSERYHLMMDSLQRVDLELSNLFQKAWFSEQPIQCPSACEWRDVVMKNTQDVWLREDTEGKTNRTDTWANVEEKEYREKKERWVEESYYERIEGDVDQVTEDDDFEDRLQEKLEEQKVEKPRLPAKSKYKISLAYPKKLSKRFASSFLLQIYLPEGRSQVTRNIRSEFQEDAKEQTQSSAIKPRQKIRIKLSSPVFDFSEPITRLIDKSINKITFLGIPKDNCEPGIHKILVSISDTETDQEFESLTINVQVVDFAFDHVSRPLLSRVSALVLGIGSFLMFALTFLEQIDKTIGLTSGTAAGIFAVGVYASFYNLYQRVHPSTP